MRKYYGIISKRSIKTLNAIKFNSTFLSVKYGLKIKSDYSVQYLHANFDTKRMFKPYVNFELVPSLAIDAGLGPEVSLLAQQKTDTLL